MMKKTLGYCRLTHWKVSWKVTLASNLILSTWKLIDYQFAKSSNKVAVAAGA